MENSGVANNTSTAKRKKGCLALAPSGECLLASLSVLGWLTFIIKFAIV